jgi:fatty-acid desaturase
MLLAVAAFLVSFAALGLGNTVGYHRLLTHRAFRASRPAWCGLALLGALHAGPPLLWVGLHRLHHLRSDGDEDPHSPRVGGFWHGHTGWLLGRRADGRHGTFLAAAFALSGFGQQVRTLIHDVRRLRGAPAEPWAVLCGDLARDPFLLLLDRPLVTTGLFVAQVGIASTAGWAGLLWLWALHLALTNASWAVNSACHSPALGSAPHDTGDGSRDVGWLAAATLGESWHNTHHRHPRSAWHSLGRGPDPSWWAIRALVALRLASDPWLPPTSRRREPMA